MNEVKKYEIKWTDNLCALGRVVFSALTFVSGMGACMCFGWAMADGNSALAAFVSGGYCALWSGVICSTVKVVEVKKLNKDSK